jgi:phage terminase large subunit-like protein
MAGRDNIKAAEEGRAFNFRLKHLEFAIPDDTALDDVRDPAKIDAYIKMSNPSLERIVLYDEIKQAWQDACASDTETARFAMYRLNLWNTSGGEYIAGADWKKCAKRFLIRDIKKYPAVIGGDFSRRRDMTALVLAVAVPITIECKVDPFDPDCVEYVEREINVPYIKPYFFLPQRAVQLYARHINLKEFAEVGALTITTGATIRSSEIAAKIHSLSKIFHVEMLGTDAAYAGDVATELEVKYGWDIESQVGLIQQTAMNIGPAVGSFWNFSTNSCFLVALSLPVILNPFGNSANI